jgi:N-methylhydantoinase B
VPAKDTGGAGLHRGGTGIEKTYVFTGPGTFTVNDDRATIPPWGINGGRHGGVSAKTLVRATGEVVELASKIDQVPVSTGDRLVFRTAGAGGWGDPLERDPQLVLRDVLRDLVSAEVARRDYGVVLDGDAVDDAATRAERARLRETRGPVEPFDFGHAPTGGAV